MSINVMNGYEYYNQQSIYLTPHRPRAHKEKSALQTTVHVKRGTSTYSSTTITVLSDNMARIRNNHATRYRSATDVRGNPFIFRPYRAERGPTLPYCKLAFNTATHLSRKERKPSSHTLGSLTAGIRPFHLSPPWYCSSGSIVDCR